MGPLQPEDLHLDGESTTTDPAGTVDETETGAGSNAAGYPHFAVLHLIKGLAMRFFVKSECVAASIIILILHDPLINASIYAASIGVPCPWSKLMCLGIATICCLA